MLSLTRREPAILRGTSCGMRGLGTVSPVLADAGLSASLSRLAEGDGGEFGSGKSPANANSNNISLYRMTIELMQLLGNNTNIP